MDIITLKTFYCSDIGKRVLKTILFALKQKNPDISGERLLGLGYATPYLPYFSEKAERCIAFMPARQGASSWPTFDKVATALVFEEDLPLNDASIDRIFLIHSLEYVENAQETLNEIWRVLSPNGRLMIVVPNRRGFWARKDNTPFGFGEPYSRGQLLKLLKQANFTVGTVSEVLHFSASKYWIFRFLSKFYEPFANKFFPLFGGVLMCEAQKRIYQGLPVQKRQSRRVYIPALAAQRSLRHDSLKKHIDEV